jgi:aminoglycoside phosphotransferase (APT) family kinase protein
VIEPTTGDRPLAERFAGFLAVVEPDRGARVLHCEPITGGYSRVSARAQVQWSDGTSEEFVLRGDPPADEGVFSSDRDAEASLLHQLAGVPSVRTPVLRWYDATGEHLGTKCMVVEALPGARSLQDLLAAADDPGPLADRFVDIVAAIHRTPLDALVTLPRAEDSTAHLDRVLSAYDRMADEFAVAGPVLRHVTWWARTHRPPPVPLGLTHGDCQPGNVLIGADGDPLVIDWEFAHIGDPRADLGYYTQIPIAPNVYWADRDRFLARYRAATGLSEEQVNADVVEYFLIVGMAQLLGQLLRAIGAIGTRPTRSGILAPYLISAISHQFDMFLSICERLD